MSIYAIQVMTGAEEKFIKLHERSGAESPVVLHFPKRELKIRRQGKAIQEIRPVFPGYVFAELDSGHSFIGYHWALRHTEGFVRFLPSNLDIKELRGNDLEVVYHFVAKVGPLAGISRAYFDENDRIVIKDGPLLGLEGRIIKVDKRKGRAKVRLDLYQDSFDLDLAFELLQPGTRVGA